MNNKETQNEKTTTEKSAGPKQPAVKTTVVEARPRSVDLMVARVEPWSVLKVSFVLSFIFGIATVLAALLVWLLLNGLHVFADIRDFVSLIDDSGSIAQLVEMMKLPRVLALSGFIAVANVILITALCTIGAMIYNITASLVGGFKLSLMDE